jgi:Ca2+/Na+ antiporter
VAVAVSAVVVVVVVVVVVLLLLLLLPLRRLKINQGGMSTCVSYARVKTINRLK